MKLHPVNLSCLLMFLLGAPGLLYGQSFHDTLINGSDQNYQQDNDLSKINRTIVFRKETECGEVRQMNPQGQYEVILALKNSYCNRDPEKRGFYCKYSLYVDDDFERYGQALCADTRRIAASLPTTQLMFKMIDDDKNDEVVRVYRTTSMPDEPFSACASLSSRRISVSLDIKEVVKVCQNMSHQNMEPQTIMNMLVGRRIHMGTIALKQKIPIYTMPPDRCFTSIITDVYPQYMVKVDTRNFSPYKLVCSLRFVHDWPSGGVQMCVRLLYVSEDFDCSIRVSLLSEDQEDEVRGLNFLSYRDVFSKPRLLCYAFHTAKPVLSIHKGSMSCQGKFVLSTNFTVVEGGYSPEVHEESDATVMMAVFISLVSACMLILSVTCICCLRMRSKRARQRARARTQNQANNNEAFTHPGVPPLSGVSWDYSDPNRVAGLPSYEEVTGQSGEDTDKPDMPPSYDSLYESEHPEEVIRTTPSAPED